MIADMFHMVCGLTAAGNSFIELKYRFQNKWYTMLYTSF